MLQNCLLKQYELARIFSTGFYDCSGQNTWGKGGCVFFGTLFHVVRFVSSPFLLHSVNVSFTGRGELRKKNEEFSTLTFLTLLCWLHIGAWGVDGSCEEQTKYCKEKAINVSKLLPPPPEAENSQTLHWTCTVLL